MALTVPTVGENKLLALMLGAGNQTLKLYTDDITPADADVAGTYTEASFTGYAAKTLTAGSWSVAQNGSAAAEGSYAEQSWTNTGPSTAVYGYFVIDATSGTLLWAERFAPTITLASGDTLKLTPKFTLSKV